jgi:hypothetical protein
MRALGRRAPGSQVTYWFTERGIKRAVSFQAVDGQIIIVSRRS